MERIVRFFCWNSWLLKLGMWMVILLWAAQFWTLGENITRQISDQPSYTFDQLIEFETKMESFIDKLVVDAKEKGVDYSLSDYYDHLLRIEEKSIEITGDKRPSTFWSQHTMKLFSIIQENSKVWKYGSNLQGEGDTYKMKRAIMLNKEYHESHDYKEFMTDDIPKVVEWATNLYLKGFIFALVLFFARMRERSGIIRMILSDKKRFFAAVFLWPLFIFKYPANVIGEIIVEAELRRMGDSWRQLTSNEIELVRRVAGCGNVLKWIAVFRLGNRSAYRRSFVFGLAAVFISGLVNIPSVRADSCLKLESSKPVSCVYLKDGQGGVWDTNKSLTKSNLTHHVFDGAIFQLRFFLYNPLSFVIIAFSDIFFHPQEVIQKLEHIPL